MSERLYDPEEITRRSYEYIDENLDLSGHPPLQRVVIRRIVHSTGDFRLADKVWFSEGLKTVLGEVVWKKLPVVTDVSMVESGIRGSLLDETGLRTDCFVHDDRARERSELKDLTRSAAGLDLALETYDTFVLVVGNAPTVLLRLLDRENVSRDRVPLVVGAPVGFVSVEESKAELRRSDFTSLGVTGNRGGSPVAASMTNALLKHALGETDG